MSSPRTRATALAAATVLVIALLVAGVISRGAIAGGDGRIPVEAVTPEEVSIAVAAGSDGTLAVSQLLVFDTPTGSEAPVAWTIGEVGLGWVGDDRDARYPVMPRVAQVSAEDVSGDSAEAGVLTVVRGAPAGDGFLRRTRLGVVGGASRRQ